MYFCFSVVTELRAARKGERKNINSPWVRAILGCQELKIVDSMCIRIGFLLPTIVHFRRPASVMKDFAAKYKGLQFERPTRK